MRIIELSEMRQIMVDMLTAFDNFCTEHGLRYFLDSGTLLGAIRHKGFIPWDDDMDVCMPRPDYDKLTALLKEEKINGYIGIMTPEEGLFPFSKLVDLRTVLIEYPETFRSELSVYIDLFPKDGLPSDMRKASAICRKAKFYADLYWFNKYSIRVWKNRGFFKRAVSFLMSPVAKDNEFPLRRCLRLATQTDYEKAEYIATIVAGGMHNCVPKSCFDSYLPVEFEGRTFRAAIGYDKYLRTLYSHINGGDYMQLPKEEQKIRHQIEVYWKDGYGE